MNGFIKLYTVEVPDKDRSGIAVDTELEKVNFIDKAALLDGFMRGLEMTEEDVVHLLVFRNLMLQSGDVDTRVVNFDGDMLKMMRDIKEGGEH